MFFFFCFVCNLQWRQRKKSIFKQVIAHCFKSFNVYLECKYTIRKYRKPNNNKKVLIECDCRLQQVHVSAIKTIFPWLMVIFKLRRTIHVLTNLKLKATTTKKWSTNSKTYNFEHHKIWCESNMFSNSRIQYYIQFISNIFSLTLLNLSKLNKTKSFFFTIRS